MTNTFGQLNETANREFRGTACRICGSTPKIEFANKTGMSFLLDVTLSCHSRILSATLDLRVFSSPEQAAGPLEEVIKALMLKLEGGAPISVPLPAAFVVKPLTDADIAGLTLSL